MNIVDYNDAYENHLMCRNCGRKTQGIEDFMTKTKKVTKTCQKCRTSVLSSIKKKTRTISKPMTLKEQNKYLKKVIHGLSEDKLSDLKKDYDLLDTILIDGKIKINV